MGRVGNSIRAVTHLDVSRSDIDFAVDAIASLTKFLGRATVTAARRDISSLVARC